MTINFAWFRIHDYQHQTPHPDLRIIISIDLELPRFLQSSLSMFLGELLGLFLIESIKF